MNSDVNIFKKQTMKQQSCISVTDIQLCCFIVSQLCVTICVDEHKDCILRRHLKHAPCKW